MPGFLVWSKANRGGDDEDGGGGMGENEQTSTMMRLMCD